MTHIASGQLELAVNNRGKARQSIKKSTECLQCPTKKGFEDEHILEDVAGRGAKNGFDLSDE